MIYGSSNRARFLRRVEDELRRQDARATSSSPSHSSPSLDPIEAATTTSSVERANAFLTRALIDGLSRGGEK